jgi:hypothetical protein
VMPLLAHGLGDAGDLPVELPVVLFLAAGTVLLAAAGVQRLGAPGQPRRPRSLPRLTALADAAATRRVLQGLGLLGYGVVVLTAVLGPPPASANPAPRLLFVVFWGLLLPVSVLFGSVWRLANPFRTLAAVFARLAGDPEHRTARPLPAGIGVWPAAVQLAVFVWAAHNLALSAGPVLALVLGLTVVQVLAANRYGPAWFRHGDPFEVVAGVAASLSPLGRDADRGVVWRPIRQGAAQLRLDAGVGVVLALVITAHLTDFVIDSPLWHTWRAPLSATGQVLFDSVTMVGLGALAIGGVHLATRRSRSLLPSFVPVAVGYAVAHDLGLLLVEGQFAVLQLNDPLGRGWDLLGLGGRYVPAEPIPAGVAAALVVLALLLGHVLGVVLGHDRARRRYPPRTAAAVQLPLRTVLVLSVVVAVWARLVVG